MDGSVEDFIISDFVVFCFNYAFISSRSMEPDILVFKPGAVHSYSICVPLHRIRRVPWVKESK